MGETNKKNRRVIKYENYPDFKMLLSRTRADVALLNSRIKSSPHVSTSHHSESYPLVKIDSFVRLVLYAKETRNFPAESAPVEAHSCHCIN